MRCREIPRCREINKTMLNTDQYVRGILELYNIDPDRKVGDRSAFDVMKNAVFDKLEEIVDTWDDETLKVGCPIAISDFEPCDNCGRAITTEEYKRGQGLCFACLDCI